jgi:DNA-binding HxlR family transcriptional regulator
VQIASQNQMAPDATEAPPPPDASVAPRDRTAAPAPCHAVCPDFHEAIELIGRRWTGAIVCALTERPMRFGELGKVVPGLSDRLLSQRLRELEDEGLVEREVEAGTPVRVTYSLTPMGEALGPAIRELKSWAKRWKQTS